MTKNYLKESQDVKQPRKSTVDFILNYSKALDVKESKKIQIVTILN